MIISPEERSSRGPLIAFIDLLFLLVAFFTLLLFFVQQRNQLSQEQMEAVQQHLARIAGEEVNVPEALETLEKAVDRLMASREAEQDREREAAERRERRAQHTTKRLEYVLDPQGQIVYQQRTYTVQGFVDQVVTPLRKKQWVQFRAYAAPETPFGMVVGHRRLLLKDSNEFDTYWDNLSRSERPATPEGRPAR